MCKEVTVCFQFLKTSSMCGYNVALTSNIKKFWNAPNLSDSIKIDFKNIWHNRSQSFYLGGTGHSFSYSPQELSTIFRRLVLDKALAAAYSLRREAIPSQMQTTFSSLLPQGLRWRHYEKGPEYILNLIKNKQTNKQNIYLRECKDKLDFLQWIPNQAAFLVASQEEH